MEHKHTLEKIAQTKESRELSYDVQTAYSECTSCGQLFETTYTRSKVGKNITVKTDHYKGLLNRNQLMDYADRFSGEITQNDEECIYLDIPSRRY